MNELGNILNITLGFIAVATTIYKVAQSEANINTKMERLQTNLLAEIDKSKDNLSDRLASVEKKLDIHLVEYAEKKLFAEYRFNATDKLIEHKFKRLANWIKQIGGFLNKESGFQIRDDEF